MRHLTLLAALALAVPFAVSDAQLLPEQELGDIRAFVALRATPIGALVPLMTPAMVNRRLQTAMIGIRYSVRFDEPAEIQAFAATGTFGLGLKSSLNITAGLTKADCSDCRPSLMLGAGADLRLYQSNDGKEGATFSLALSGEAGYAQVKPIDEHAVALGVGLPLTVTFAATPEGFRFAPYFTPVFGLGSVSGGCPVAFPDCEESGVRAVLGGGLGVWGPTSNVSASIGVNQVVLEGAKPVFGVNVQIGGR
jgi:hypothetical protein